MKLIDKHIELARLVAIKAHGDQAYDELYPYVKHLDDVANVLRRFGWTLPKYLCSAYLHDVIEDTGVSYNDIKKRFGEEVAEIVFCVTDEIGRNRKEKHNKTYPKIASNPEAIIIKLADRIANVEHGGKSEMYVKEYKEFKEKLYPTSVSVSTPMVTSMWECLDDLFLN